MARANGMPDSVEVYRKGKAHIMDAVRLGSLMYCASEMTLWKSMRKSDAHLHLELTDPSLLAERPFPKEHMRPVFLMLLDLNQKGWSSGREPRDAHIVNPSLTYSVVDISKKPYYLLCLLDLDKLKERGMLSLPANAHDSWYALALRSPAPSELNPMLGSVSANLH